MKHFTLIDTGIDTTPIRNALAVNPALWNENRLRTEHPGTVHGEADDIWILFNDVAEEAGHVVDDIAVRPYRGWWALPQAAAIAMAVMHRVGGIQLGRVIVTRLAPGCRIAPHVDQGAPAEYFTRYQFAIQSLPGALFNAGPETVNFSSGDVWRVDNRVEHSVVNNSADDRTVLIVDVRVPVC